MVPHRQGHFMQYAKRLHGLRRHIGCLVAKGGVFHDARARRPRAVLATWCQAGQVAQPGLDERVVLVQEGLVAGGDGAMPPEWVGLGQKAAGLAPIQRRGEWLTPVHERAEYVELAHEHREVLPELVLPVGIDGQGLVERTGRAVQRILTAA